ncbi:MAG: ATP-grasp domain-containing protein, partial [Rhodospirillales bacterium]|nr:ATP-grasp domain-containing protein [Rhodospirillales bacterium]
MTGMFLRLTEDEVAALDMLYVARFAVDPREPAPALDPADGVFPYYNHELAKVFLALGIKVTPCRDLSRLAATVPAHNYVFTIYNRAPMRNCELFVSTICESVGVPYLGAPPNVRALAEDKYWTKLMAKGLGLPVPEGTVYRHEHDLSRAPAFDGPYFIKPRFGAASEEIAVDSAQDSWAEAQLKAAEMLSRGKEVLVEQCISGTDLTVPVLGGWPPKVLAVAEEISDLPNGIATYRQKRLLDKGRQRSICEDQAVVETVTGHVRRFVG